VKRHMALGDFLVAYLRKIGVSHVFGIPGTSRSSCFSRSAGSTG